MARARSPLPVKLVVSLLGGDADLLRRTQQLLQRRFGPVDDVSELWPYPHDGIHAAEMGPALQRRFLSFERLVSPAELPVIKLETNALEAQIASDAFDPIIPRPVNIDPGYVEHAKLVFASAKDRPHRVYLSDGIFGEVTLRMANGAWQPEPWTYPDFAAPTYHEFLTRARERLLAQRAATSLREEREAGL